MAQETDSTTPMTSIPLKGEHSFRRVSIKDLSRVAEQVWKLTCLHQIPMLISVDFPENYGALTPPYARGGPSAILNLEVPTEHEARARVLLKELGLID